MWEQNQIKRTLNRPESLARVNALVQDNLELHRTALADRVCATFGFTDARGRVQRAGAPGPGHAAAKTRKGNAD